MTMRANLDEHGKLIPPRSLLHAERRLQQLRHELAGIEEHAEQRSVPVTSKTEIALRQEERQLLEWMHWHREGKTTMKPLELDQQEWDTVLIGLRAAADAYEADERMLYQAAMDIREGKHVMMFACGAAGIRAATRLAEQFGKQAKDARALLAKLEAHE